MEKPGSQHSVSVGADKSPAIRKSGVVAEHPVELLGHEHKIIARRAADGRIESLAVQ